MTGRKRAAALLLCIGLILVLSVSTAFLAQEAGHDCCGEDCPVCRIIAVNIRLLRTLSLVFAAAAALLFLRVDSAAGAVSDGRRRLFSGTPVSWKIRLNN